MAGQFSKLRSDSFEEKNGVKLPSYRGDNVNGHLLLEVMLPCRGLTCGISILLITASMVLDISSAMYRELAHRVDEDMGFMAAAGLTVDHPIMESRAELSSILEIETETVGGNHITDMPQIRKLSCDPSWKGVSTMPRVKILKSYPHLAGTLMRMVEPSSGSATAPCLWKFPTRKMHGGATRWYRIATLDETKKLGVMRYNHVALLEINKCKLGPWRDVPISRSLTGIGQLGIKIPLRCGEIVESHWKLKIII
ncbi:hypothetical protein BC332_25243 [Capsicum chinense]|nr:hypothetical protein BC332_25243 [Capsicum chinense]